jgi:hypothetical protein
MMLGFANWARNIKAAPRTFSARQVFLAGWEEQGEAADDVNPILAEV